MGGWLAAVLNLLGLGGSPAAAATPGGACAVAAVAPAVTAAAGSAPAVTAAARVEAC